MSKLLLTLMAWVKETTLAFQTDFVNTFSEPVPFIPDGEGLKLLPIHTLETSVGKKVWLQRIDKDPESDKSWPAFTATVQDVHGAWVRLVFSDERRGWVRMEDFTLLEVL